MTLLSYQNSNISGCATSSNSVYGIVHFLRFKYAFQFNTFSYNNGAGSGILCLEGNSRYDQNEYVINSNFLNSASK